MTKEERDRMRLANVASFAKTKKEYLEKFGNVDGFRHYHNYNRIRQWDEDQLAFDEHQAKNAGAAPYGCVLDYSY